MSLPFVSHSPCAIGALRERDWQMPVAPGLDPKAGLNLFDLSLLDGAPENGGTDTRFAPLPVVDEDARREVEEIIGDAEAYAELVAVFLQEGDETLSSLEDAVACGDAAAARRLSHTLKGSCSSIGVARIAEMLSAIETAARAGECDDDLTYRLRPEWSAVHAHLAPFAAPASFLYRFSPPVKAFVFSHSPPPIGTEVAYTHFERLPASGLFSVRSRAGGMTCGSGPE